MKKINVRVMIPATLAWVLATHPLGATGGYDLDPTLASPWYNLAQTPEFYWELEVKRLAGGYHPDEKFHASPVEVREAWETKAKLELLGKLAANADSADFAAALKTGAIGPPDAAGATAQHEAARQLLAAEKLPPVLPEEFDSEFADYHRGALAYRLGKDHWDEARAAWEALLKRPEAERHYRSVWATFMLGKIAMKREEAGAVAWFQQTRALAKAGFSDSLGLAADSYGWEARSEWKQGHPEKAAPLYLTQLALGDETAVNSLKALIPDRMSVEGMLNYGPDSVISGGGRSLPPAQMAAALQQLKVAAADPLLRRLVTVHILATETYNALCWGAPGGPNERYTRWLGFIKEAKLQVVVDAEYLGWMAYSAGKYDEAAEWLKLAKPDTPAACWLRSKFERRAGKTAEAQKSMAKAFQLLSGSSDYGGWSPAETNDGGPWGDGQRFRSGAAGNLGALMLERAEFIDALKTFLEGKLWGDAAFVAERILTADELIAFVEKQAAPAAGTMPELDSGGIDPREFLRALLGRRLVREDRYAEARHYMQAPYDKILDDYVQALKDGANEKLPKARRARAWFHAAWLARYDGMELMGTNGAPDGSQMDLVDLRENGPSEEDRELASRGNQVVTPIAPEPSKQELRRLKQHRISPEVRFHYRVIGAALAMRAAALLPDNTEELADVITQAGRWVTNRWADRKLSDRYYYILEKRCWKTKVAAAALKRGAFVEQSGPWSKAEETARNARAE